jgi:hypothetical protein
MMYHTSREGGRWKPLRLGLSEFKVLQQLWDEQNWLSQCGEKSVLSIPEDSIPAGMKPSDFASEWTKFNGVIVYKAKLGTQKPEQVSMNSIPVGIFNRTLLRKGKKFTKVHSVLFSDGRIWDSFFRRYRPGSAPKR